MTRGTGLNARFPGIEQSHVAVVGIRVLLGHFHGLELLQLCFFGDFVFPFVCITGQVTHIGDVADITHPITQMRQVAVDRVKGDRWPTMSQMRIPIDRRPAHIHAHKGRVDGCKILLLSGKSVVELELMCFHKSTMYKVPSTKYNIFLSLNLTFEVFKTSKVLVLGFKTSKVLVFI